MANDERRSASESRARQDRRHGGADSRSDEEKRLQGERRSNSDRRSGLRRRLNTAIAAKSHRVKNLDNCTTTISSRVFKDVGCWPVVTFRVGATIRSLSQGGLNRSTQHLEQLAINNDGSLPNRSPKCFQRIPPQTAIPITGFALPPSYHHEISDLSANNRSLPSKGKCCADRLNPPDIFSAATPPQAARTIAASPPVALTIVRPSPKECR